MQNKVKEFNSKRTCHKTPMPTVARLLDIQSEMGELAKEYLKSTNYGTCEFKLTDDFKEEYGDVLYALISLADELEINCEECLGVVLQKLEERMKKTTPWGVGDKNKKSLNFQALLLFHFNFFF